MNENSYVVSGHTLKSGHDSHNTQLNKQILSSGIIEGLD